MRLEIIKKIQILTKRQAYALQRENIEYYQELLEDRAVYFEAIKVYNREHNSSLTQEERQLLQQIQVEDERNKQLLEQQLDEVKVKLRQIRMSEMREVQYAQGYGGYQESGVFFDKKGY